MSETIDGLRILADTFNKETKNCWATLNEQKIKIVNIERNVTRDRNTKNKIENLTGEWVNRFKYLDVIINNTNSEDEEN